MPRAALPLAVDPMSEESRAMGRLRWRCRRGMRELDVLLLRYLEHRYAVAQAPEQRAFERLLEMQDPLIMALLTGRQTAPEPDLADVVARLTAISDGPTRP